MDMEKARDLNGRMVALEMISMGLGEDCDPPSLEGIELVDLLEASRMVADDPGEVGEDGMRSMAVHCDPRLVAALYVAANCQGTPIEDLVEDPVVVASVGRNRVVVIEAPLA